MAYINYLKGAHWLYFKRKTLSKRRKCEICFATRKKLCVHHRHYKTLGHERKEDVLVLCDECHGDLHVRAGTLAPEKLELAYVNLLREKNRRKRTPRHHPHKKTKRKVQFLTNPKRRGILGKFQPIREQFLIGLLNQRAYKRV